MTPSGGDPLPGGVGERDATTKRDGLIAAGFNPQPSDATWAQGFNMTTGQLTDVHCLCLVATDAEGTTFKVCCICWYLRGEVFSMQAKRKRGRKP